MNKIKILIICLIIPFLALIIFTFLKIKSKEEFQHKIVLAQETRKALEHLMVDLSDARESSLLDAPADGQWHHRLAFIKAQQGAMEYTIKDGQLFRSSRGESLLIADNISDLRIRRQKETPDILEVQLQAQNETTLLSNLKIRVYQ